MTFLSILTTIVGVAMGFSGLPQAIKIFKTKSAGDVSPLTYIILLFGGVVWALYGIEIKSVPLVLSNAIGTFTVSLVLFSYYRYSKRK